MSSRKQRIHQVAIAIGLVAAGSIVVFISVSADLSRADANYLNVQKIG